MASRECNKSFASNYLLLKPQEATIFQLILTLFSSNMEKRKFVDCPLGTTLPFQSRCIVVLSVVLQKILKFISKPLAWLGSVIEVSLNLLANNGGLWKLIFNFIRGKLVIADKNSASYSSFIAFLDSRLHLDPSIERGHDSYYAALSMMASKVAYENSMYAENAVTNYWKMEFLGFWNFWNDYEENATTQAYMFRDQSGDWDTIVVAFRGTEPFNARDWISDIDLSFYEIPGMGRLHAGFMKALGLQKSSGWPKENPNRPDFAYYAIRAKLRELLLQNEHAKFIVVGHSLGAALAVLFPAILALHEETTLLERLVGIYNFGQPRVGDRTFGEFMTKSILNKNIRYRRFVYSNDVVPRVPPDAAAFEYKHFDNCIYVNAFYKASIVEEEPNKNYFNPLYILSKLLTAIWELIRSFLIPLRLGNEYKETAVFGTVRLAGLLLPGVPAHCPQDYVNSTRLAYPRLVSATHQQYLTNGYEHQLLLVDH